MPVVLRRFKPAKVGETEPLEMEEFDLETADFTADVTIHFYGRLPLEAAE